MTLTLPPRVTTGDSVALVSPSWFGAGAFPHRVDRGRVYLESLGLHLLDYATKADLTRARKCQPGDGWLWLHPGKATGTC